MLLLNPSDLADLARNALEGNDSELLEDIDLAFHHLFLMRSRKGSENSRIQFMDAVLSATESGDREVLLHLTLPQRLSVRWEHLAELMEAFRQDRDRILDAVRLVNTRPGLKKIVAELVATNGETGSQVFQLAKRLNLSRPNLVNCLNTLEQHDIIERHRSGRNTFVSLGLVGQLVVERLKAEEQSLTKQQTAFTGRVIISELPWMRQHYQSVLEMTSTVMHQ